MIITQPHGMQAAIQLLGEDWARTNLPEHTSDPSLLREPFLWVPLFDTLKQFTLVLPAMCLSLGAFMDVGVAAGRGCHMAFCLISLNCSSFLEVCINVRVDDHMHTIYSQQCESIIIIILSWILFWLCVCMYVCIQVCVYLCKCVPVYVRFAYMFDLYACMYVNYVLCTCVRINTYM